MKKSLLLLCAASSLFFSNCKKKHDDPAPVTVNVPVKAKPSAPAGSTKSGTLTTAGQTQTFDVLEIKGTDYYALSGTTTTGAYSSLSATFMDGKPTKDQTIDFDSDQTTLNLGIGDSKDQYVAIDGTATITVTSDKVSVSFTNVHFISTDLKTNVTASGQISSKL